MGTKHALVLVLAATVLGLGTGAANGEVLLWEPFDGTVGDSISTLGWTTPDNAHIDATVIDAGNSVKFMGDNNFRYFGKDITPRALNAGEHFELTFVGRVGDFANNTVGVRLYNDNPAGAYSGDMWQLAVHEYEDGRDVKRSPLYGNIDGTWRESGSYLLYADNGDFYTDMTIQFRLIVAADSTEYQFYDATIGDWSTISSIAYGTGSHAVRKVELQTRYGSQTGGNYMDSVKLEVIPEPATLGLIALGAVGVIRRRK